MFRTTERFPLLATAHCLRREAVCPCYAPAVKALKAHVRNGQIVFDEPVELPEGASVQVLLPENDELTATEHEALEAALEESAEQFARGEFEDAHAFARRLVAKS